VTAEVQRRWGPETEPDWPLEPDSGSVRFAVVVDAEIRGMIQYHEETDPIYRHAEIDIMLDPAVHGRGLGRDTVATLTRHLIEDRGHHRLVINPSADNATRSVATAPLASDR
jgi:RimJ/RimL family protein N-acetyltransferase